MDKSNAWRAVAQDIKVSAAKEANDWAATTSKPKEVQAYNPKDNKCRYNRKGFLEDDDSSDDSIFIMDPGWDDYCLQELKLNRPVLCCPNARRARGEKESKAKEIMIGKSMQLRKQIAIVHMGRKAKELMIGKSMQLQKQRAIAYMGVD
ncbi:hypothetical protein Tco_0067442 [Tanacetum coccineum]